MAASTKLINFLGKNELNKLLSKSTIIFHQSIRSKVNCLGEKKVDKPKLTRARIPIPPRVNDKIIWPDADAVKEKGFLRPQKEYIPPSDVELKLNDIFRKIVGVTERSALLEDEATKYNLLDTCHEVFNHKIPNSVLHKVHTLDDVYNFYLSPVDVRTPLEAIKTRSDLPPNLHIQYEYTRFDPDKFNGITAFPESNTVVTGLKAKKKYKGYQAPRPRPTYDDEFKL